MILSQIIMLYTLNLYRALFQLYLNKTERKKMEKKKKMLRCGGSQGGLLVISVLCKEETDITSLQ